MKMRSAQVELLFNHTYILKIPLSIPIGRKCLAMKAVYNVYMMRQRNCVSMNIRYLNSMLVMQLQLTKESIFYSQVSLEPLLVCAVT